MPLGDDDRSVPAVPSLHHATAVGLLRPPAQRGRTVASGRCRPP